MVKLAVNGQTRSVDADLDTPLLYAAARSSRASAKYGCGLGQCGLHVVMVDGEAVYTRASPPILLLEGCRGGTTLEGLGDIENRR